LPPQGYTAHRKRELSISREDDEHHVERRDKLEIILAILEISQQPIKKTHILYTAKINYYQLTRYLDLLLATNMIGVIAEPIEGYKITEKGRLLLNMFGHL
jgi:predicted transcriptional regulator